MKMVRNIAIVAFAASFMFANVGFHMANNYQNMDDATTNTQSYGVTYDLNATTSVGWDSEMGLLMYFAVPNTGVSLRLGWSAASAPAAAETSMGLGYTWWTGGDAIKTSIGTNYDYVMAPGTADEALQPSNSSNLSVTIGFGF